MDSCLREVAFLMFAVVAFSTSALGGRCFQSRVSRGGQTICTDLMMVGCSKAECCSAGGEGWSSNSGTRRCEKTCEMNVPHNEPQQTARINLEEVRYCFRTRRARGSLGQCEGLIGRKTKLDCCLHQGRGWTEKASGKRCEDTCSGEDDSGPVGTCYSGLRNNDNFCENSLGRMSRLQCCQDDGAGWSETHDATACGSACLYIPVNGGWGEWSNWWLCSVSCGEGTQRRRRRCNNPIPAHGGADCEGSEFDEAICDEGPCPVNGGWSRFSDWSACTQTCDNGFQTRERTCDNPTPQHGGIGCFGKARERRSCGDRPCPINGGWGSWRAVGTCSGTCKTEGSDVFREIQRTCDNPAPAHGGVYCEGSGSRMLRCRKLPFCPIDGGWSDFSEWSTCSSTCGSGIQFRSRSCDNPRQQYGGRKCLGEERQQRDCRNRRPCPIDGGWSEWGLVGSCSQTCRPEDGSLVYREQLRTCDDPPPAHGGRYCDGLASRRILCRSLPPCPVDGGWSEFGDWTPCSMTCDSGIQTRERSCNNPLPQNGGQACQGEENERRVCINHRPCPVHGDWSHWGSWSECNARICGEDGNRFRSRTCTNPSPMYGGNYCEGRRINRESCSVCPEPTPGDRPSGFFQLFPEDAIVPRSENHVLKCVPRDRSHTVTWEKDGAPLQRNEHVDDQALPDLLLFTEVRDEETGLYTCVLMDNDGDRIATASANIIIGTQSNAVRNPQVEALFLVVPEDAVLTELDDHVLRCIPVNRSHTVTWEKEDAPIEKNKHVDHEVSPDMLVFTAVRKEEAGIYTCVLTNNDDGVRIATATATIIVADIAIDSEAVCGTITADGADTNVTAEGRIVGGHKAVRGSAPWMVRLYHRVSGVKFCAGSLLNNYWVVTAAHCISKSGVMVSDLMVFMGDYDTELTEESEVIHSVEAIHIPDGYDLETFDQDIALIKLQTPVIEFTDFIRPICFPNSTVGRSILRIDNLGKVTGWGQIAYRGPSPRYMTEIILPVVGRRQCRESTQHLVTPNMFCAGYPRIRRDACSGDSGGPFAMEYQGRWFIVGIVSWGEGCGLEGKYGFYTKVTNFLDWTDNYISI